MSQMLTEQAIDPAVRAWTRLLRAYATARSTSSAGKGRPGGPRWAGPAPPGGAVVTLSSNSSAVFVPATMTVPAGAWRASFAVMSNRVRKTTAAKVTATYNGGSVSASLSVSR